MIELAICGVIALLALQGAVIARAYSITNDNVAHTVREDEEVA